MYIVRTLHISSTENWNFLQRYIKEFQYIILKSLFYSLSCFKNKFFFIFDGINIFSFSLNYIFSWSLQGVGIKLSSLIKHLHTISIVIRLEQNDHEFADTCCKLKRRLSVLNIFWKPHLDQAGARSQWCVRKII